MDHFDTMTYPYHPEPIHRTLSVPGSKSITNRALLLAALAEGTSHLKNPLQCHDALAMQHALTTLGVHINTDGNNLSVQGNQGRWHTQKAIIDCQDAGTVLRFLLPICAIQSGLFQFKGSKQLMSRPIQPILDTLRNLDCTFHFLSTSHGLPLEISGKPLNITAPIWIQSDISSQFLSGLLIASPLMTHDVHLYTHKLVSEPYVSMTCCMMQQFGVTVQRPEPHHFYIPANQHYQAQIYNIEPDASTASYFLAAAALTQGTITLQNLYPQSLQGDIMFLEILKQMGCKIETHVQGITVTGTSTLKGIDIDLTHCSDLFMTVACLCAFADSPSIIRGIQHIRFKESDRILSTRINLERLGIQLIEHEAYNAVEIIPHPPQPAILDSYQDHRIVMAFALFGLKVPGIIMRDTACVQKTCPDFETRWHAMLNPQNSYGNA